MGFIEKFATWVMGDRRHSAEVLDNNFAESANLEIDKDDTILTVQLNTVVGDGNDITKINYSREGLVEASKDAYPGDDKSQLVIEGVDIGELVITMTYVDSDNSVIDQDEIKIEPLAE